MKEQYNEGFKEGKSPARSGNPGKFIDPKNEGK
jgi:hypothetical protein